MSDLSDNDIDTMDEDSDLGVGYEDDDSMDEGKLFANGHTGLEGGPQFRQAGWRDLAPGTKECPRAGFHRRNFGSG